MSLTVANLSPQSGTEIGVASGHNIYQEGSVVQTVWVRSDNRNTYTSLASGDGTAITELNLTITPKNLNSTIWLRWCLMYEVHHDNGFVVQRNGTLIGYNSYRGNVRYSNILTPLYDNDYSSTPQNSTINWFDKPATLAPVVYSLAIRSTQGSNFTFALNRSLGTLGQASYENGVSFGFAREIYRSS